MIYDMYIEYCIDDKCIYIIYIRTIDYINSYYWDVSTCHGFPAFLTLWTPWHLALHRRGIGLFAKLFPHLTSMKFIGFIQLWYFKMFSRFDTTIQFVFFFLGGFRVTCEPVSIWHLGMIFFSRHLVWAYGLLWIWSSCHRTPSPKVVQYGNLAKMTWHFRLLKQHTTIIIYIYTECIEYFFPTYDVFVSSIMCPIWLSFYESYFFLMTMFKYSLLATPSSLEYTILSIFEW